MDKVELEHKIGKRIIAQLSILHHNAFKRENLVFRGTTSLGTPIYLNRALDEADFRIGIGNISLSKEAGYGGGAKIVMPGTAGAETINRSHAKVWKRPNQIGRLLDNPIRKEVEESGKVGNLDFIINTVLNERDEICRILCGDPFVAFKQGIEQFNDIYKIAIQKRFDLLIVGSSPMDSDFYQANKALSASSLGVRDGGTIIMISPCTGGISTFPYFDEMIMCGNNFYDWQKQIAKRDFKHKVAAEICLSLHYLLDVKKIRIGLITPGIPDEAIVEMGLIPYRSVEAALTDATEHYGKEMQIGVIPKAPLTLLDHSD